MADKQKWSGSGSPRSGFRKVWLLDAQWSDCPVEVVGEVKRLWRSRELGNDNCIVKTTLQELREMSAPIAQYVLEKEPLIDPNNLILIHWWW